MFHKPAHKSKDAGQIREDKTLSEYIERKQAAYGIPVAQRQVENVKPTFAAEAGQGELLTALRSVLDMVARGVPDLDVVTSARALLAKAAHTQPSAEGVTIPERQLTPLNRAKKKLSFDEWYSQSGWAAHHGKMPKDLARSGKARYEEVWKAAQENV
jgi:hypothetical protein